MFGLFSSKKRKQAEFVEKVVELQQDSQKIAEDNTELGKEYLKIAKENTKISESIDSKSGRLIDLVAQNEEIKQSLSQRDVVLRAKEDDMEERRKKVRTQEIDIVARISEVRRQESDAKRQDKVLDDERISIKKRENVAQKLAADSKAIKEDCDALKQKLNDKEDQLKIEEEQLNSQSQELNERRKKAESMFEKADNIEKELEEKERAFEEKRAGIEHSLNEKIKDYDRKIADMESVQQTVDAVKFDSAEEGKTAKIVVQEALRQAKKNLEDSARDFGKLQEKYGEGTFRGFAIPLSEIDNDFQELRELFQVIDEHATSTGINSFIRLKDHIAEYLEKVDNCRKSWELPESYRHICYGIATCKNYELFTQIIKEMQDENTDESENDDVQSGDEPDYYEVLRVSENASNQEIKQAHKKLVRQYHPDTAHGDQEKEKEFTAKMQDINRARDVLLDKKKRAAYNERRKHSKRR